MATTPSNRLKLTPSNSPFLPGPARSPLRAKSTAPEHHLSLKRVVGTTCASPTGFDATESSFAYIAGGAVVVVDVDGDEYSQRFYRARPTAHPIHGTPAPSHSPSTPSSAPKANDSRGRVSLRDSGYGYGDNSESPTSRTWTSRERIKAATCVALSKEGRFLAVGETGYAPRVLIFSLKEHSSDIPLVSISEHGFGVRAVAWSSDSKYLASLGTSNDGFLYIWRIEPRTGAAKLFQQNRCTSYVRGMFWISNNLVTLGVRHVKVWRVEEARPTSPAKQRLGGDLSSPAPQQKALSGRNVLLGDLIETTFSCAVPIDQTRALICSETGDVCLFDDTAKQMKLTKVLESGFATTCVGISGKSVYLGGKSGGFKTLDFDALTTGSTDDCVQGSFDTRCGLVALGFLKETMVTVDVKHSINISRHGPSRERHVANSSPIIIAGHGEPILGVEVFPQPNDSGAVFCSWTGSGHVIMWDANGKVTSKFDAPLEQVAHDSDSDLVNQLTIMRVAKGGDYFVTGDKLGVLRIIDSSTKECVSSLKVHTAVCQSITVYQDASNFLIASCGRDRTAQLIRRTTDGAFEHFQTLEFAAKVAQVLIPSADKVITCSLDRSIQIHDLVTKEGEPDVMAAIVSKALPIKASPISMTMESEGRYLLVSSLDRSINIFDMETYKLYNTFKCTDENGLESVVLDSLVTGPATENEPAFLLGISNTDKSIRIYNSQTGEFLDREWGHTEGINGVALIEDESGRKVVSAGTDGTIMVWEMDLQDQAWGSPSGDTSPDKEASALGRPTLRRVLSKAELAEFQRTSATPERRSPTTATAGRKSPPRTLAKRRSYYNLNGTKRPPVSYLGTATATGTPTSPASADTPSRRPSSDSRSGSPQPPASPKSMRVTRRPSLPSLSSASKKKSSGNLRAGASTTAGGGGGFGSLSMATEQACRTLRAYRKKLAAGSGSGSGSGAGDPISRDALAELDQELRLTALALGDRAARNGNGNGHGKAVSDSILDDILDQYSERLVSLLDEKLKLGFRSPANPDSDSGSVSVGRNRDRDKDEEGGEGEGKSPGSPGREDSRSSASSSGNESSSSSA